jgi:hypothetical protein
MCRFGRQPVGEERQNDLLFWFGPCHSNSDRIHTGAPHQQDLWRIRRDGPADRMMRAAGPLARSTLPTRRWPTLALADPAPADRWSACGGVGRAGAGGGRRGSLLQQPTIGDREAVPSDRGVRGAAAGCAAAAISFPARLRRNSMLLPHRSDQMCRMRRCIWYGAVSVTTVASVLISVAPAGAKPAGALARYGFNRTGGVVISVGDDSGHGRTLRAVGSGTVVAIARTVGRSARFPAECCGHVVLEVPSDAALNPGRAVFTFGATVRMTAAQTSPAANVMQKGYASTPEGEWKLQVDGGAGRPVHVRRTPRPNTANSRCPPKWARRLRVSPTASSSVA